MAEPQERIKPMTLAEARQKRKDIEKELEELRVTPEKFKELFRCPACEGTGIIYRKEMMALCPYCTISNSHSLHKSGVDQNGKVLP